MSKKRLLLVDDEPALLLPMVRYFTRFGYDVSSVRRKEEALALLEAETFDLVILDVMLDSGAAGLDILRHIQDRGSRTPVVILSGLVTAELRDDAVRLGAAAVLQKPQLLSEIARMASELLASDPGAG
jgi:DNA-binding response OmpR family regulator